jgi:myo-inositol-1(or 4)-monophosphatase
MMKPTLSDLEDLTRRAGEILRAGYHPRPGFGNHLQIDYKGEIDLVTEVDRQIETFLLGEIQKRFPGHRAISEESSGLEGRPEKCWYIDPLDGTVNFVHGLPNFAVSLAYAEQGMVELGAVYDPTREECFTAERGKGAWLNGEPIRVSAARHLGQSLLVTGFPYDIRTNPENNLDLYSRFSLTSQGVRRLGSAAQDLCYVAAGRLDGYWEIRINAWDIAAGALIAAEAGATVTNVAGTADYLSPPESILAANPAIHAQMLEVMREAQNGKRET